MIRFYLTISWILFLLQYIYGFEQPRDSFHEELFIKNLPSGHVYTHFQFSTTWNVTLGTNNACKLL